MSLIYVFLLMSSAAQLSERYLDCVELVTADIDVGRIAAQQWVGEGGGADARHCLAVADLRAGFPRLAAARFEDIAERKDAGDDLIRSRLLQQASEAWLIAKDTASARRTIDAASALAPDAAELLLTEAKVLFEEKRWSAVIDAISNAEAAGFFSTDGFLMRGRARTNLGDYENAAHDVVAALSIDPTNVDALVLRGDIQRTGIVIDVSYANAGDK